jgi:hypothetical protein
MSKTKSLTKKMCRTCRENKSVNEYSKNNFILDGTGLQPDCKDCMGIKIERGKNAGKEKSTLSPAMESPNSEMKMTITDTIVRDIEQDIRDLQSIRRKVLKGKVELVRQDNKYILTW